jgi:curved DNA-binding protein
MDYYEILGVAADATPDQIKKAFRQIARECHPDVTGEDPKAAERFKDARKAYETLIDPATRQRYDRRGQRNFSKGSFFEQFYRQTGGGGDPAHGFGSGDGHGQSPLGSKANARGRAKGAHDAGGTPGAGKKAMRNPANDLDLEDLFNTFGFGAGAQPPPPGPAPSPGARAPRPQAGGDITIDLEVPALVARDGGSVTVVYHRMQRSDSWRPGSPDPGIVRIQDITDIRMIPGTRDGEVLRERGLGDAGPHGGTYGDLVARVRVVGRVPQQEWPRDTEPPQRPRPHPEVKSPGGSVKEEPPPVEEPKVSEEPKVDAPKPEPDAPPPVEVSLEISLVEAVLGGRVEVPVDGDRKVRLTIPPGTSSGVRMRLKGKGPGGVDLFVVTRVMVPKELDAESRRLIEEFALLNPGNPRDA